MRLLQAIVASLALTAACGWTPADEQVLIRFFERSRAYDKTLLAPVATVVFDPRTDGVVERFRIVDRSPESHPAAGHASRTLTLQADVRSAGGRLSGRRLVVTVERRDGSWIVTGVE